MKNLRMKNLRMKNLRMKNLRMKNLRMKNLRMKNRIIYLNLLLSSENQFDPLGKKYDYHFKN
jgi:trichohyalin